MERSTQNCTRHGHPEFVLSCADEIAFDLPWLLNLLEDMVASGTVFTPGETFQLGWSILMVRNASDGRLSLWELDQSGEPGRLEYSVTRSLLAFRRQKAVLESFGIVEQVDFPSLQQTAVMCLRFGTASRKMLSRAPHTKEDSGWFFGCREQDHDHQRVENITGGSLYQLACANPEVMDFLAMPTGAVVLLDDRGKVEGACDSQSRDLQILPGSYLELKDRGQGAGSPG